MATVVEPLDNSIPLEIGDDAVTVDSNAIFRDRSYPSEKEMRRASIDDEEANDVKNKMDSFRTSSGILLVSKTSPPEPPSKLLLEPCPNKSTNRLIPSGAIINCSRNVPGLEDNNACRICRDNTRA